MKRNLSITMTEIDEALSIYVKRLKEVGMALDGEPGVPGNAAEGGKPAVAEESKAAGLTTAETVYAKHSVPFFDASAMDGVQVRACDIENATEETPVRLKLNQAEKGYNVVNTGHPIKAPYDTVVMAEVIKEIDDETVEISKAYPKFTNVRLIGEDIKEGDVVLEKGHMIRPLDIGALLASGNLEVMTDRGLVSTYELIEKTGLNGPRVGIIPTGSEIIKPDEKLEVGKIIDSNSGMLQALCLDSGAKPKRYGIVKDVYNDIRETLKNAVEENDIVIVNAGSSAGTEDYTEKVLAELGELVIHGIAMKPGKPAMLAIVDGKPVIGLPGYPIASFLTFEKLVLPLIEMMGGKKPEVRNVKAILDKKVKSPSEQCEFLRVLLREENGVLKAEPFGKGASSTMNLVRTDGFLIVPVGVSGYDPGDEVEVELVEGKTR